MTEKPGNAPNPEVKPLANTAESIRSELNNGKKIDLNDPKNAIKVSIAWAKRNPKHPLSEKVTELQKYGDLLNDTEAAKRAIEEIKKIQTTLKIPAGDGVIGPNTLAAYEAKDKANERGEADKIIQELDASLYGTDLTQRTEQALKNRKIPTIGEVTSTALDKGLRPAYNLIESAIGGTKVKDAKGVEYTVKKTEGKTQYLGKDGEIFELRENKMVSLTKESKEKADYLKKLTGDMISTDRAVTDNLRDVEGNALQMVDTVGVRSLVGTGDKSGKIYNLNTGAYEDPKTSNLASNTENTKNVEQPQAKIGNLVIKEGEWSSIDPEQQFIRDNDKVISYKDGKYSIGTIDPSGKVGTFTPKEYGDLPQDFIRRNNQKIAQEVVEKYGSMKDWEMFAPSVEISGLKLGDLGRGTEEDGSITPEAAERVQFLKERLAPTIAKNPKMQEMTLGEYAQFSENPALIASSRFMKEVKTNSRGIVTSTETKTGFVNPDEYGIPSDFEYAATGTGTTIKKPKTNSSLDTIMIAGKDGKYESQKDWLQKVKVDPGKEYVVYGMEDMRFKKSDNGDIMIYKKGNETTPESTYIAGEKKWNEIKKAA